MAGWPSQRATAKTSRGKSFTGHPTPAHLLLWVQKMKVTVHNSWPPCHLGTPELNVDVHRFGNSQAEVTEEVWLLSTADQNWERQQADKPGLVLEIQWLVYEVLGSILSTGGEEASWPLSAPLAITQMRFLFPQFLCLCMWCGCMYGHVFGHQCLPRLYLLTEGLSPEPRALWFSESS